MDERLKADLSRYRFRRAEETLAAAQRERNAGDYYSANNRAYYCVFHAIRAILALDGEDYKRHSAVLSKFNQRYVKTGVFDSYFGKMIYHISEIRNQSDYEDYYICTPEETEELLTNAARFLQAVRAYLQTQRGLDFPPRENNLP